MIQITTDSNRINGIEENWVMAGDPILQESGWEELRKEARKIEGDLDVKLNSYNKLGARFSQGGSILFLYISVWIYISLYVYIYLLVYFILDLDKSYICKFQRCLSLLNRFGNRFALIFKLDS